MSSHSAEWAVAVAGAGMARNVSITIKGQQHRPLM
jgi:hypothetical protein